MRKQLGNRLPEFTPEDLALVKGSNDFFGLNSYGDNYIKNKDGEPDINDFSGNLEILDQNVNDEWIGPETGSAWLRPNPQGFRGLLNWLNKRYGGPAFYVTENGTSIKGENDMSREKILEDDFRCEFFRGYIGAMAQAHAQDGVDVRGYTGWSLMEYVSLLFYLIFKLGSILRRILAQIRACPSSFPLRVRRRNSTCRNWLPHYCRIPFFNSLLLTSNLRLGHMVASPTR